MNVVRDAEDVAKHSAQALVVTGDGKNETDRIKAIAPKFDGNKDLIFPYGTGVKASGVGHIVGKQTASNAGSKSGLSALSVVKRHQTSSMRNRLRPSPCQRYIFFSDREDLDGDIQQQLESKLRSIINSGEFISIEQIEREAYRCECKFAQYRTIIYCAFVGDDTGCFEDGLADLLELKGRGSVHADNRDELKRKIEQEVGRVSGESLLDRANETQIETAFPNLSKCLKQVVEP